MRSLALSSVLILVACAIAHAETPVGDRVPIDAFFIDRTEVTIGQFARTAAAQKTATTAEREGGGFEFSGGWTRRPGWTFRQPFGVPGADTEPAVHVTWAEARDHCAHVGGRLPTFAEWQRAAYTETRTAPTDGFVRGQTYTYPVGDAPDGMNNNRQKHLPVASTRRGVNGLYDMGANAWEWLAERRGDDALTAGGSWWYGPDMTKADAVQWKAASFYAVYIGFRCVYDAPR